MRRRERLWEPGSKVLYSPDIEEELIIGVKMLNISRNPIHTWAEIEGILGFVEGATTLIMKCVIAALLGPS